MTSMRTLLAAFVAIGFVGGKALAQEPHQTTSHKGHVTKVVTVVHPEEWNGPAPAHLKFTGTIFVSNPPVDVEYTWIRSDGAKGPVKKATIRSAGEGFTDTWDVGAPKQKIKVWERLEVHSPNRASCNPAHATVNCR
ncbi:MAG TPA: hypothetical protein VK569_08595 [Bacteroidota bacterium]|nr:hypothetical protein [Bacteroidota bacterium]